MNEDQARGAMAELQRPHTVWAPDGTTFVVRAQINDDLTTPDQLNDVARLIQYEIKGPETEGHTWIASWDGTFVPDPSDEDVPAIWRLKAEIALAGWLRLCATAKP